MRIEDVVGDYVNLKRSGASYKGLCPIHGEKTPSFYVTPAKNIFKCFGCGEGGDAISFLQTLQGLSYVEALRVIAKKYGITIQEEALSEEVKEENKRHAALQLVNNFARDFYHAALLETDEGKSIGLSYFKHRGYSDGIIEKFELGFAPPRGDALKQAALAKGYQREYLKDLGLLTKDGARDFLRDRVIFPIHSSSGKVVAFAGRILKSNTKAPKYLNSPETELYNKSKTLYGLHLARTAMRREDQCLITEGYADVIALHQAGIENAVATSGTSLTAGHISLIKRLTQRVVFLYDGDKAGVKAALRGLDLVLAQDMEVRLVLLPDGHDPDSYVKAHGGEAFREYIKAESKDFIAYKSDLVLAEAKEDPIARARLVKDVLASIAQIPDPIVRTEYVRTVGERFEIGEASLVQQLNTYLNKRYQEERRAQRVAVRNDVSEIAQQAPPPTEERPLENVIQQPGTQQELSDVYREKDIINILLRFGDRPFSEGDDATVGEFICMGIQEVLDYFQDELCRKIANTFFERFQAGQDTNPAFWSSHENPEIRKFAAAALTEKYEMSEGWWEKFEITLTTQKQPDDNWQRAAKRSILRFKLTKLQRKMNDTTLKLQRAQQQADAKEEARLLRLFTRMLEVKKTLSAELGTVVTH